MLVLDALTAAAHELANPDQAPELRLQQGEKGTNSGNSAPRLQYPSKPPRPKGGDYSVERPRERGGKTRVWGPVALRKLGDAAPKTHRNAFADIALRWAGGLLHQVRGYYAYSATSDMFLPLRSTFKCISTLTAPSWVEVDAAHPGLDLLGRDTTLLGKLLATLAAFSEYASGSLASTPLACATLELLRSPQVRGA